MSNAMPTHAEKLVLLAKQIEKLLDVFSPADRKLVINDILRDIEETEEENATAYYNAYSRASETNPKEQGDKP